MGTMKLSTRALRTKRGSGPVLALLVTLGVLVVSATTLGSTAAGAAGPPSLTAYIASFGGFLNPIDTKTNKADTPIPLGGSPFAVAITPNGATAYVVDVDNGTVVPINLETRVPGTPIPVGTARRALRSHRTARPRSLSTAATTR
jgi:DNA-binding beta-propeller fold protein YncE